MTVIMRAPDLKILVLTKGADSAIFQLLIDNQESETLKSSLNFDLEIFSESGLRTLCYSSSTITETEYQNWAEKYKKACLRIENREQEIEKIATLIEKDLTLLGATAIEDKLQEGVPEAIDCLLSAGIKIWVLTGDKTETAVNIGYSCNVLPKEATLLIIRGATLDDDGGTTLVQLVAALRAIEDSYLQNTDEKFALVIDGNGLII